MFFLWRLRDPKSALSLEEHINKLRQSVSHILVFVSFLFFLGNAQMGFPSPHSQKIEIEHPYTKHSGAMSVFLLGVCVVVFCFLSWNSYLKWLHDCQRFNPIVGSIHTLLFIIFQTFMYVCMYIYSIIYIYMCVCTCISMYIWKSKIYQSPTKGFEPSRSPKNHQRQHFQITPAATQLCSHSPVPKYFRREHALTKKSKRST